MTQSGADLIHDNIGLAIGQLNANTGKRFSVTEKDKDLHKWGFNSNSANGTFETVQGGGGTETLLTTNAITVIDSTSASDTGGIQIAVEGHYLTTSGQLVFTVQTVTLTGTTAVALSTPLARCSRMYVVGTETPVGTITANAGEGGTAYNQIAAGDTQSEKCATTFSYKDAFIITQFGASILGNNNAAAQFRAELRLDGGVWRPLARWSLKGDSTDYDRQLPTPFTLPPNTDIRIRASASAAGTQISAHFDGLLAIDLDAADPDPAL